MVVKKVNGIEPSAVKTGTQADGFSKGVGQLATKLPTLGLVDIQREVNALMAERANTKGQTISPSQPKAEKLGQKLQLALETGDDSRSQAALLEFQGALKQAVAKNDQEEQLALLTTLGSAAQAGLRTTR